MPDSNEKKTKHPYPRLIHHWRTPRTVPVGAFKYKRRIPQPDDPAIPCANLYGMWMTLAGIQSGMDLYLSYGPGWVTLKTPERVAAERKAAEEV